MALVWNQGGGWRINQGMKVLRREWDTELKVHPCLPSSGCRWETSSSCCSQHLEKVVVYRVSEPRGTTTFLL